MRQRRWIDFVKGYDFPLQYHLGKANVVANALSRKTMHVSSMVVKELESLEEFRDLSLDVRVSLGKVSFGMVTISCDLKEDTKYRKL